MVELATASRLRSDDGVASMSSRSPAIRTTLFDLLAALNDAAGPDDEALIVALVAHWSRSGRLKWHHSAPGAARP